MQSGLEDDDFEDENYDDEDLDDEEGSVSERSVGSKRNSLVEKLPKTRKVKEPIRKELKFEMDVRLPSQCFTQDVHHEEEKITKMCSSWFRKLQLQKDAWEKLCFNESLLMVNEFGHIAGKMYTSVSPGKWGDEDCLCAHSGSYGKVDEGAECGTTVTGFVTFQMRPIQEYVYEWAVVGGKRYERKTFLMKEKDVLHLRIMASTDGEITEKIVRNIGIIEQRFLVTESMNIILLRLLLQEKRVKGEMQLRTLTFQGNVVKSKYVSLGKGWENVKGETVSVWSIRRIVNFNFGDKQWDYIFNKYGRLILRCQPEGTHALIPLWFEPVKEFKDGKPVNCYPQYVWACDPELYAKYLLKKDELSADYRAFLLDHPQLRALLSDFIQEVLMRKPAHIIAFAQQYFEAFIKARPVSESTTSASSVSEEESSEEETDFWDPSWE